MDYETETGTIWADWGLQKKDWMGLGKYLVDNFTEKELEEMEIAIKAIFGDRVHMILLKLQEMSGKSVIEILRAVNRISDIEKLEEELKEKAISLGLCEQWTKEWTNPDKDELVDKYVRGIDFCIQHDYPSIEYMIANFRGVMEKHGVFADNDLQLRNRDVAILNGACAGVLEYDWYSTGRLYIRHDSDIKVVLKGNAKVFISIYDNANVNIICQDNAKCYVYKYGGSVSYNGNVIIRDRSLE